MGNLVATFRLLFGDRLRFTPRDHQLPRRSVRTTFLLWTICQSLHFELPRACRCAVGKSSARVVGLCRCCARLAPLRPLSYALWASARRDAFAPPASLWRVCDLGTTWSRLRFASAPSDSAPRPPLPHGLLARLQSRERVLRLGEIGLDP
jgi:hypothetical protein